jgi:uncharacterized membrane protein
MDLFNGLIWNNQITYITEQEEARKWIEWTVTGIEALAIVIVVIAIAVATVQFLLGRPPENRFRIYRQRIGYALMLVLEILIAADIVHTVVLEPTLESVGVLGLLVIVRTVLSWTLVVDIESRWPWKKKG